MPIVCVNRPNRSHKRTWKASDVGRIACYVLQGGGSWAEMKAAARERGCITADTDCDCEELRDLIEQMVLHMAAAAALISTILAIIAVFSAKRGIIGALLRMFAGKKTYDSFEELLAKESRLSEIEREATVYSRLRWSEELKGFEFVEDPINIIPQ